MCRGTTWRHTFHDDRSKRIGRASAWEAWERRQPNRQHHIHRRAQHHSQRGRHHIHPCCRNHKCRTCCSGSCSGSCSNDLCSSGSCSIGSCNDLCSSGSCSHDRNHRTWRHHIRKPVQHRNRSSRNLNRNRKTSLPFCSNHGSKIINPKKPRKKTSWGAENPSKLRHLTAAIIAHIEVVCANIQSNPRRLLGIIML